MAASDKAKHTAEHGAAQTQALIDAIRENSYVQRLVADESLRNQIQDAYASGRSAYKRANKAKNPAKALMNDKKLQKDLREALDSAKSASSALREAPSSRGGGGSKLKLVAILLVGAVVAVVASSSLRDKVLDLLFGPEETFDYVPTANGNGSSAQPAQAPQSATS